MVCKRIKKAVSAIVGTVMLVLVTVAAGSVVWQRLIPTITQNLQLSQECINARLNVDTQTGFTCYDEATGTTTVVVSRGAEQFNLNGILISLKAKGTTFTYLVRDSDYAAYAGDLQCQIKQGTCPEEYSDLFHLNTPTNSHAERSNLSNYDYKVCCKSTASSAISGTCERRRGYSDEPTPLIYLLFNETNSHVTYGTTLPTGQYNSTICLNFTSKTNTNYSAQCSYDDRCVGGSTCLIGLAQQTDSHVGDCTTSSYKKVCCSVYNETLGKQEIAYITKWGSQYPLAYGKLPGQNEANKFTIEGEATEIAVLPIIKAGINEKLCPTTAEASIPKCA